MKNGAKNTGRTSAEPDLTEEIAIAEADHPSRQPNFPPAKSWPGLAVICWVMAALTGAAGLFGWLGGPSIFASFGTEYIPIAHSEATLFIVMGFTLAFYVCGITRRFAKPMAGAAVITTGVFSALKLTEYLGRAQFGIENIFKLHPGTFRSVLADRMSPVAALVLLLISVSLCLLILVQDQRRIAIRWAAYLACIGGFLDLTVILGYFYGTPLLYGGSVIPMSLPTAWAFFFLILGSVIAIGPRHIPVRPFLGNSARAQMLRAFLPITLIAVIIDGSLYHLLPLTLRTNGAVVSALSAVCILTITSLVISRVALKLGGSMELAEEKQNEAREQLKEQVLLLDVAPDAIFSITLDGKIQFWNQSSTRLFGWAADEAMDQDAFTLVFRGGSAQKTEITRSLIEGTGGQREFESRETRKDGTQLTLSTHLTLVRSEDGKPIMILIVCRDITVKKALEVQRLRSERLQSIGTLASGIAHDVNNALLPILFSAEMLKKDVDAEKRNSFIDQILKNADRVRGIMKQILLFVGGGEIGKQTVDLKKLLVDTRQILEHTLPKTIEIQVTHSADIWPIVGDETQISQVFMNLCINARDAMGENGFLKLTADNVVVDETQAAQHRNAKAGPHVCIAVSDTGSGIPTYILDKIFDPFFTTKEFGKGTGLGLSTVLGIVESHRGFIAVHSQVNQGTRFEIWLPAARRDAAQQFQPVMQPPPGQGELILIVDDEEDIRAIAQEALEENGYRVLTAVDGTEAVALFAQHRGKISAVLCDMMMPVMDGPTTIRALKRLAPAVPVIAMSGLIEERATSAKVAGASAMLQKPFTASTLLGAIGQELNRAKEAREGAAAA